MGLQKWDCPWYGIYISDRIQSGLRVFKSVLDTGYTLKHTRIEYHPGFVSGLEICLWAVRDTITIEEEHYLSRLPLRIDLLIIKNEPDAPLEQDIFQIFRRYNIIEYKSPADGLTIDDYVKTIAYACLYKAEGTAVNSVPLEDLTVSFFRNSYPRKLMKELRNRGAEITTPFPGVYYVSGLSMSIPVQFVIMRELTGEQYTPLRVLAPDAGYEDVFNLLMQMQLNRDASFLQRASSVITVSAAANPEVYRRLEDETGMKDALMYVFGDLMDRTIKESVESQVKEQVEARLAENLAEARKKERAEGRAEGLDEGILCSIRILRKKGFDDFSIASDITEAYHLTRDEAERFLLDA